MASEIFFTGSDKPTDPKDLENENSKRVYDAHSNKNTTSRNTTGSAQRGQPWDAMNDKKGAIS